MKLVTFELQTAFGAVQRMGALAGEKVVDIQSAFAKFLQVEKGNERAHETAEMVIGKDMLSLIEGGTFSMDAAKTAFEYASLTSDDRGIRGEPLVYSKNEVQLKVPFQPLSIRDTLNGEVHFRNSLRVVGLSEIPPLFYERPYYYRTSHTAIAGPEDQIPWPSYGEQLDYELEFAAIIGKKGMNIPAEKAHEYIMGYTVFNDISIRDYQRLDMATLMGPSKCKNFTHGNIIGPCITTSDELDPTDIRLQARVNGETWSDSRSTDMYYSFAKLIEYISKEETLYPGEVICSGTMAWGCGLELGRFLQPNDIIELEVEGIGILRNQLVK
jgi:2-keto-4-pentenoate hydratase/2-oxohepta-3-ene-1,7-dioic acid hydratase in catechol pathway